MTARTSPPAAILQAGLAKAGNARVLGSVVAARTATVESWLAGAADPNPTKLAALARYAGLPAPKPRRPRRRAEGRVG